jgi:hypothetical protein
MLCYLGYMCREIVTRGTSVVVDISWEKLEDKAPPSAKMILSLRKKAPIVSRYLVEPIDEEPLEASTWTCYSHIYVCRCISDSSFSLVSQLPKMTTNMHFLNFISITVINIPED